MKTGAVRQSKKPSGVNWWKPLDVVGSGLSRLHLSCFHSGSEIKMSFFSAAEKLFLVQTSTSDDFPKLKWTQLWTWSSRPKSLRTTLQSASEAPFLTLDQIYFYVTNRWSLVGPMLLWLCQWLGAREWNQNLFNQTDSPLSWDRCCSWRHVVTEADCPHQW